MRARFIVGRELVRDVPDYEPARVNLYVLGSPSAVANGETAAADLPPTAAVDAIDDESELLLRAGELPLQFTGR